MKLRTLFVGFLSIYSIAAWADPKDTLSFAKALIQARVDYNQSYASYLRDPNRSPEEKRAHHQRVAGHMSMFFPYELADRLEEGYVNVYRGILNQLDAPDFIFTDAPLDAAFQDIVNVYRQMYRDVELFAGRDPLREAQIHKLVKLYFKIWTEKQNQASVQERLPKQIRTIEEKTGYSEIPALRKLLAELSRELGSFWRGFNDQLDFQSLPGGRYQVTLPKYQDLMDRFYELTEEPEMQELMAKQDNLQTKTKLFEILRFRLRDQILTGLCQNKRAQLTILQTRSELPIELQKSVSAKLALVDDIQGMDRVIRFYPVFRDYVSFLEQLKQKPAAIVAVETPSEKSESSASDLRLSQVAREEPPSLPKNIEPVLVSPAAPEVLSPTAPEIVSVIVPEQDEGSSSDSDSDESAPIVHFKQKLNIKAQRLAAKEAHLSKKNLDFAQQQQVFLGFKKQKKVDLAWIKSRFNPRYADMLRIVFDDSRNDRVFRVEEIESLVKRVGGKIVQNGTSHCKVILPGGVSDAWYPHQEGHQEKLSRFCLQRFRAAFQMAGITPDQVLSD
jgi:hypothetical protein